MKKLVLLLLIISFGIPLLASPSFGEDGWRFIGVRWGFPASTDKDVIHLFELYSHYQLPWDLRSSSGWGVSPRVEVGAGGVTGRGDSGAIISAGPAFAVGKTGFPVELNLGINVAILSRDTFGNRDYNGIAQFVSYGGLAFRVAPRVELAYRFQHMSNAGMNGNKNPGVNHHVIGLRWYFDKAD